MLVLDLGTPSGGDWAVSRTGALYFENTEGVTLSQNLLTTLDGHGVFFSVRSTQAKTIIRYNCLASAVVHVWQQVDKHFSLSCLSVTSGIHAQRCD